jgi:hypothetical protein
MRYLCIALLLSSCIIAPGCASAPKPLPAPLQGEVAGTPVDAPSHYGTAEIQALVRSGKVWLARDSATNGWLLRDSSGVVATGVALAEPSPPLGPQYGDCLAK